MAIFQCDLRRKNYGALWNNLFNFFHLNYQNMFKLLKLSTLAIFLLSLWSCSSDKKNNVNVGITVADNAPSASEGFDLEQFHRLLIEEGENENQWDAKFLSELVNREDINNLDLNQNGYVDTILIDPFGGGDTTGFQLYTKVIDYPGMENDQEQTIATVSVEKNGETGSLTVSGNEQMYGTQHHYHSSGLGNFFLMYWLLSPRYNTGRGFANTNHTQRKTASTSAYNSKKAARNAAYTGKKAPTAQRPSTVKQTAVKQKTAAKGIKSKLSNPTASQRSFKAQTQAKKAASGFKKSTGKTTRSSGGRSGGFGGK